MDRRQFIIASAVATSAGLAGCLGDGDTDSPDSVVEAFYQAGFDQDHDEMERLLHPRSPIDPDDFDEEEESETELESVSAETLDDDIDPADLDERELRPLFLSDEEFESLAADEDVALVEITLEERFDDETHEETFTVIVATDNGDWRFVDIAIEDFDFGDF